MATDRHDRFLRLERPRRGGESPDPLSSDERFEGLGEPPGSAPPAGRGGPVPARRGLDRDPAGPSPSSAAGRFGIPPERPLETAALPEGAQPFSRCARCEMDSSVYARACQNCGADLEAPEQRNFNEEFWARRRAEAAAEKAAEGARARERDRMAAEETRSRRELATEMARRERDRVEDELDEAGGRPRWRSWGAGDGEEPWGEGRTPAGIRLLRMIPGTGWKIAAVAAALVVPLLLVVFGRGGAQLGGMAWLVVVGSLFSNGRRRWRRW